MYNLLPFMFKWVQMRTAAVQTKQIRVQTVFRLTDVSRPL